MKKIAITALLSCLLTFAVSRVVGSPAEADRKVVLENERVRVIERSIPPRGERAAHIRSADQVIVFLNDAKYERVDPETGETTVRERAAGEAIWHSKGEDAPKLTNINDQPMRSLVIELQ